MPVSIDELTEYANQVMALHKYPDYGPMGLQFKGRSVVERIASTVSLSKNIIETAKSLNVDAIVAHHGLFWNNEPRNLDFFRGRLQLLRDSRISIFGYHLCLDRNSMYGNNSLAIRKLGLTHIVPWEDVGYSGTFKKPMPQDQFFQKALEKFTDLQPPIPEPIDWLTYGPKAISKVALITGGAPHYIVQAHMDGFDTFVTGETAEPTIYLAQDLRMNFLSLGHYRTETLGVRKFTSHLASRFHLKSMFIDAHLS